MFKFKNIITKLKDVIALENGNSKVYDKDVAKALQINQLTFATMKKRERIPYQEILDFCAYRKLSINWLLYDQITASLDELTEQFTTIRYFSDIQASAGGGAEVYDEDAQFVHLDNVVVDKLGGERELKNIEAINVTGDSMEPTLKSGDMVYINKNITKIDSGIFVISTIEGLFIKRLEFTKHSITLQSDNKLYNSVVMDIDTVKIIGKVVGVQSFLG